MRETGRNLMVQALSLADMEKISAMEARATNYGWSRNQLDGSFRSGHLCYKLLVDNDIHGYCVVRVVGGDLEILNIVISSEFQGKGFGSFFLQHILRQPEFSEIADTWLEVRSGNLAARALYKKFGFNVAGKRRGYYSRSEKAEDALIMQRTAMKSGTG